MTTQSNVIRWQPEASQPRTYPVSPEAEMAVLGAILLSPELFWTIQPQILESDFFESKHRIIYRAMNEIAASGDTPEIILISSRLRDSGSLRQAGGVEYMARLGNCVPAAANLPALVKILREKAALRSLAEAGEKAVELATTPGMTLDQAGPQIEAEISNARHPLAKTSGFQSFHEAAEEALQASMDNDAEEQVRCGFPAIDEMTGGWSGGDFIIIAARPSMGKTALALAISKNAAKESGPVAICSLEMTKKQLALRHIASDCCIDYRALQAGLLSDHQWDKTVESAGKLASLPILIDDESTVTVSMLRSKLKTIMKQCKIRLLLVDYLQLLQPETKGNRSEQIGAISSALKRLAKEFNIPIIALSQLSRDVEKRGDHRPQLADLRESGSLEQDADCVIFIYREEYYARLENRQVPQNEEGRSELLIGKQRNGPVGRVYLRFVEKYARFETWKEPHGAS